MQLSVQLTVTKLINWCLSTKSVLKCGSGYKTSYSSVKLIKVHDAVSADTKLEVKSCRPEQKRFFNYISSGIIPEKFTVSCMKSLVAGWESST